MVSHGRHAKLTNFLDQNQILGALIEIESKY